MGSCKVTVALLIIVFVSPSSSAETFKAGQVFRDCPVCPEMVAIPTGKFAMGSNTGKVRERPLTPISIKKFIAIGKYELTFDEWDVCYKMLGCSTKPEDRGWGRGRRPVININYKDIKEYLVWITKKTKMYTGYLLKLSGSIAIEPVQTPSIGGVTIWF